MIKGSSIFGVSRCWCPDIPFIGVSQTFCPIILCDEEVKNSKSIFQIYLNKNLPKISTFGGQDWAIKYYLARQAGPLNDIVAVEYFNSDQISGGIDIRFDDTFEVSNVKPSDAFDNIIMTSSPPLCLWQIVCSGLPFCRPASVPLQKSHTCRGTIQILFSFPDENFLSFHPLHYFLPNNNKRLSHNFRWRKRIARQGGKGEQWQGDGRGCDGKRNWTEGQRERNYWRQDESCSPCFFRLSFLPHKSYAPCYIFGSWWHMVGMSVQDRQEVNIRTSSV